jgi:hypothetical protein
VSLQFSALEATIALIVPAAERLKILIRSTSLRLAAAWPHNCRSKIRNQPIVVGVAALVGARRRATKARASRAKWQARRPTSQDQHRGSIAREGVPLSRRVASSSRPPETSCR